MIAILPAAKAVPIGGKHFIIFFDRMAIDAHELMNREHMNLPSDAVIELVPVFLQHGESVEDAVRIYEIEGW